MKIPLAFPLFLSLTDHNFNAALQLYGPPAMVASDIIPALPPNETNRDTLARLIHDLLNTGRSIKGMSNEYYCMSHDATYY